MERSHLVSVIMPCYNSGQFVIESIFSVLNQSYRHLELICVDDNSTDNTLEILQRLALKDNRMRVLKNEANRGPGYSRNIGIDFASGRFIAFCDSDDRWYESKLEIQLERMLNEGAGMSFGDYYVQDGVASKLRTYKGSVGYNELLIQNFIGCLTVVIDKDYIQNFRFHELRKRQDWLTWLSVLRIDGINVLNIQHPLADYVVREGSVSSSKISNLKYTYLVYRELGMLRFVSIYRTIKFLVYHLILKI